MQTSTDCCLHLVASCKTLTVLLLQSAQSSVANKAFYEQGLLHIRVVGVVVHASQIPCPCTLYITSQVSNNHLTALYSTDFDGSAGNFFWQKVISRFSPCNRTAIVNK